jgi:hypothetical protein
VAQWLVLKHEPTRTPSWDPVAIIEKTLEEGGEAAIAAVIGDPVPPRFAAVERWKAVRFDDGPEMVPSVSLAPANGG